MHFFCSLQNVAAKKIVTNYTNIMENKSLSIRPFIGAKDFAQSRSFYRDMGFEEVVLFHNMSLFQTQGLGFYLQDAYVKDWIDNSMIFLEVADAQSYWNELLALDLTGKYPNVKLTPVHTHAWGKECYLHDPSGILWHFGQFTK
jgi:catechol 2,3-dioxygenase-like lactoylglutathione lyase family enzyme